MTANYDPNDPRARQSRSDQQPSQQPQGQPQGPPQRQPQGSSQPTGRQPPQQSQPQGHRSQGTQSGQHRPQQGMSQQGMSQQGMPKHGASQGMSQQGSRQPSGMSPQPTQGGQAPPQGGLSGMPQGRPAGGGMGTPGAQGMPQPQRAQQRGGRAGRPLLEPITIEDVVAEDVVTAQRDTPVRTIVAQMSENDVGSVVVVDDGEPLGLITDRAVALTLEETPDVSQQTAEDILTEDLVTADTSMTVFDVLQRMSDEGIRRLPVVDDEDRLQGIVSLDDVLVLLGTELGNAAETIQNQLERL